MLRSMRLRTLLVLVALVAVGTLAPGAAEAGCLVEANTCESCAKRSLWEAMKGFSLSGILDANRELWDCDIDLYHCVFFGSHHEYKCAV